MELRERLLRWNGKEVARLEECYDLFGARPDFVSQALGSLDDHEHAQAGATWLLKRHLEEGHALGARDVQKVAKKLAGLENWGARLHVLQCLSGWPLPVRARTELESFVREAFESPVKFVRAWAYSGLHALAEEFEDLRPETLARLEEALEDGPASVRARVRKLLKKGFSDEP